MVSKRRGRREKVLVVEIFLVGADSPVEFLFSILLDCSIGNLQNAVAEEANDFIIFLEFRAD